MRRAGFESDLEDYRVRLAVLIAHLHRRECPQIVSFQIIAKSFPMFAGIVERHERRARARVWSFCHNAAAARQGQHARRKRGHSQGSFRCCVLIAAARGLAILLACSSLFQGRVSESFPIQLFGLADGASPAPTATVEYSTGADSARISAALGAPMSAERIADVMAECGVDGKVRTVVPAFGCRIGDSHLMFLNIQCRH